ncbi:MAG: PKD domain-containing protein [Pyrinomonadaceae bacterium]|nr:PKD domain-containing protein [Pyrinomonadaceae bacterium]
MNRTRSFVSFFAISLMVFVASVLVADSSHSRAMVKNITMAAFNKTPDAVNDSAVTNKNLTITIDVLRNDFDGDGDKLTVGALTQPANGQVINNGVNVTYTPNLDFFGQDSFTYTVSDGLLADTAVVTIGVNNVINLNQVPSADAGPDQTALVGANVQLNGGNSSDPDGDPLTFQWSFQSLPIGSTAVLFNSTAVDPTFVLDQPGIYIVQLVVNDGNFDSAVDTVQISTGNSAPVANAGADQTAIITNTVTLDGSGSTDIDGNPLTFQWSFQSRPVGSTAMLSDPTAVNPSFVVDQPGNYIVELIVNDGLINSAPDTVIISTQNSTPVANAGPDQSTSVGSTVQLDGSGSNDVDGDPLTFQWSFVSRPAGSTATLTGPTTVIPTFLADQPGTYVIQLIVNDGFVDSAPDTVMITTENSIPIANAGPDQTVTAGATVQLDGSASTDPDGTPLQFSWALITWPIASVATLSDATIVNPTFVADLPGVYIVQLIVSDGVLASAADTVMITAVAPVATLTATDADAAEAGLEPGSFTVSRSGDASFALTVAYAVGGTATNGTDYTLIPTSVTIPAGSPTAVITITPVDDNVLEDSESIVLTLLEGDDYDVGTEGTATVTIADNDPPAVSIDATDPDAAEVGGDSGTFTVSRTGPTTSSLTVSYTITGSATNGNDYTTLPTSVVIPAGAASASITVAPLDDAAFELPESVVLTLVAGSNYLVGSPHFAGVTIADNDSVVSVLANDSAASEDGPNHGSFEVSRNGPTTNALTVFYATGGSAINGTDYATLPSSVIIPAGSSTALVTVTPIDDALSEGPETVVLSLSLTGRTRLVHWALRP